ncbi:MAG: bifunctional UDP-N-acetylglucosamine diphosphorylase/glucosamine-1-phosphate N-acetyltransferase GlmU [Rhodospirillales bacterium]
MSAPIPSEKTPAGPISAIVLAAGLGTRMKSDTPKVMHRIAGQPLVRHVVDAVEAIGAGKIVVVTGDDMDDVRDVVAPHPTAIQHERLGTGHAVAAAREAFGEADGTVLVLFGADPLIEPATLAEMVRRCEAGDDPAVVVLGFRPAEPGLYGRLIADRNGTLTAIVEARDATDEQLAIELCNAGAMAIKGERLWRLIDGIDNDNAKNEYYLTDIVALARDAGDVCAVIEASGEEIIGVDSRADLAEAEAIMQQRLRRRALDGGATLIDPASVFFSADTKIGRDVVIEPNVFFGPGVTIGDNVTVHAFCHIEQTTIGAGTTVGPFARLRGKARIGEGVRIGNFVEMKNVAFGDGAKASHLAYVGDSTVGAKANIGAGTITCNYDGINKNRTEIGAGAFIGSNTALVAPVRIGKDAIVGAGSTVTKDVGDAELALTRAEQRNVPDGATRFRARQKKS